METLKRLRLVSELPLPVLSLLVLVFGLYGAFADPSGGGALYIVKWWIKVGALVLAGIMAVLYMKRASSSDAVAFQWPIKLFVSIAVASILTIIVWLILAYMANSLKLESGWVASMVFGWIVGFIALFIFALGWAFMDGVFDTFAPRDVMIAWGFSALVQGGVVGWLYWIDRTSSKEGLGASGAAVGVAFAAFLIPPIIGMISFFFGLVCVRSVVYGWDYLRTIAASAVLLIVALAIFAIILSKSMVPLRF